MTFYIKCRISVLYSYSFNRLFRKNTSSFCIIAIGNESTVYITQSEYTKSDYSETILFAFALKNN